MNIVWHTDDADILSISNQQLLTASITANSTGMASITLIVDHVASLPLTFTIVP